MTNTRMNRGRATIATRSRTLLKENQFGYYRCVVANGAAVELDWQGKAVMASVNRGVTK